MAYFDGIKVGDRVWSFDFGWGEVEEIKEEKYILVVFKDEYEHIIDYGYYNFDGQKIDNITNFKESLNQVLFWDEVKFEIPKRPKIELKETEWKINLNDDCLEFRNEIAPDVRNGLTRNDKETAEKALKQIKKFAKLLALRDQECQDSRGYEPKIGKKSYGITKEAISKKFHIYETYDNCPDRVYFKAEEDAKKICDILNSRKFDLEGE